MYQADKALLNWHTEFDQWFHVSMKGTTNYMVWNRGLEYLSKAASKFIVFNNGRVDGLRTLSHSYKIGEMKTPIL